MDRSASCSRPARREIQSCRECDLTLASSQPLHHPSPVCSASSAVALAHGLSTACTLLPENQWPPLQGFPSLPARSRNRLQGRLGSCAELQATSAMSYAKRKSLLSASRKVGRSRSGGINTRGTHPHSQECRLVGAPSRRTSRRLRGTVAPHRNWLEVPSGRCKAVAPLPRPRSRRAIRLPGQQGTSAVLTT